jgi:23S rRNA (guanosine2251-2'-O)-methyltransferase
MFYLQQSGIKMVACTEKGTTKVWDEDLTGPVCIILGSEEDGISSDLLKKADSLVEIPMSSTSTSLNVSVSAGIVLYEMYRQRFS